MKKTLLSLTLAFTFLVPALSAFAQPVGPQGLRAGFDRIFNPDTGFIRRAGVRQYASPQAFIFEVLRIILSFLAVLAIVVIIIGGIMYILALGDEKKSERAKHTILYAVIGLVLIGISGIIVNVIIAFFFI